MHVSPQGSSPTPKGRKATKLREFDLWSPLSEFIACCRLLQSRSSEYKATGGNRGNTGRSPLSIRRKTWKRSIFPAFLITSELPTNRNLTRVAPPPKTPLRQR